MKLKNWFWLFFWAVASYTAYKMGYFYYNHKSYEADLIEQMDRMTVVQLGRPTDEFSLENIDLLKRRVLELAFRYDAVLDKKDIEVLYNSQEKTLFLKFPYTSAINYGFRKIEIPFEIKLLESTQKFSSKLN